jgi:hypothetical protein
MRGKTDKKGMEVRMDTLTLKRVHPVQGKPVHVVVEYNGQAVGTLEVPFTGWLKLKKLLEKGGEVDNREGGLLGLKVKVIGVSDGVTLPKAVVPPVKKLPPPANEMPLIYTDDEEEGELKEALEQAKQDAAVEERAATAEELVRSLRGESNG